MAHRWYAIQTYAGSEKSVRNALMNMIEDFSLQDKILEVLVPTEDVIEMKDGKKKITERSLYSGYVFAQIDLDIELWHKIQSMSKVSGFIGESKNPTPMTEAEINKILEKVHNRSAPKPKISYHKGEMVRIIDGPFANFTGMVDEYDLEHGSLKLNVSIFGRSTPVDISFSQVEKII